MAWSVAVSGCGVFSAAAGLGYILYARGWMFSGFLVGRAMLVLMLGLIESRFFWAAAKDLGISFAWHGCGIVITGA
ncbi:hypothetical protein U1Q18_038695 [Sarracenia purpurea var. burkii]